MTKLCRCGHQDMYHHPRLKYCQHAEGSDVACVCQGFVLVAGSTSTPRTFAEALDAESAEFAAGVRRANLDTPYAVAVDATAEILGMDRVADLTLTPGYQAARAEVMAAEARAEKAEEQLRAYVETEIGGSWEARPTHASTGITQTMIDKLNAATLGGRRKGWDPIEAADQWDDDARKLVAERRRAAVLHPIAQAAAAEHVVVDHQPCYACGHLYEMHTGDIGPRIACEVHQCPCPVYIESPPPDACGRCGHAQNLHQVLDAGGAIIGARCVGTGVDEYGHEIARGCQCGRMGGYTPEQPAEISPWEKVMLMGVETGLIDVGRDAADPLCLCGHAQSEHGPITDAIDRDTACKALRSEGGYADSCIEFRPATITERLANGVIIEHTTRETR